MKDLCIALVVLAILVALFSGSYQRVAEADEPVSGTRRPGDIGQALQGGGDLVLSESDPHYRLSPKTGY